MAKAKAQIWTIGHSTHPIDEFIRWLQAHKIKALADVRRFPGSRRQSQFGNEALRGSLDDSGIEYHWFEALGGRRSTKNLSAANSAWEVKAFHAYADYTLTAEFEDALARLETLAHECRTAYMCAEAQWTRCHRRLISDALTVRGWDVLHITSAKRTEVHKLPGFARVNGERVTYPGVGSLFDN
jgi:uncharacterized protein (DUF488 family)